MMKLYDLVVLTEDLPEYHLVQGDTGVIVYEHIRNDEVVAYELEIFDVLGESLDVITVESYQLMLCNHRQVRHAQPGVQLMGRHDRVGGADLDAKRNRRAY